MDVSEDKTAVEDEKDGDPEEMDFPEDWMVLDDADEEHMEEESSEPGPSSDKVTSGDQNKSTPTRKTNAQKKEAGPPSKKPTAPVKQTPAAEKKAAAAKQPTTPGQTGQSQSAASKTSQGGTNSNQSAQKEAVGKGVAKPATQAVKSAPGKSPVQTKSDSSSKPQGKPLNQQKAPGSTTPVQPKATGSVTATSTKSSNSSVQSKSPAPGPSKTSTTPTTKPTNAQPNPAGSATPPQPKSNNSANSNQNQSKSATPSLFKTPTTTAQGKTTTPTAAKPKSTTPVQPKSGAVNSGQAKSTPSPGYQSKSAAQRAPSPQSTPKTSGQKITATPGQKPGTPKPGLSQGKSPAASASKVTNQAGLTVNKEKSAVEGKSDVQVKTAPSTENKTDSQSAASEAKADNNGKAESQGKTAQPSTDRSSTEKETVVPGSFKDHKLSGDAVIKLMRLDEGKKNGKTADVKKVNESQENSVGKTDDKAAVSSSKPGSSTSSKPGTASDNKPATASNNKPVTANKTGTANKPGMATKPATASGNKSGTASKPGTASGAKPGTATKPATASKPGTASNKPVAVTKPGTPSGNKSGTASKPEAANKPGTASGDKQKGTSSSDKPANASSNAQSKTSNKPEDKPRNRSDRPEDRYRTGSDDRNSSRHSNFAVRSRESWHDRSYDRRRSRSSSYERWRSRSRSRSRGNSRDRYSRYGRSDDRNSSRSDDNRSKEVSSSKPAAATTSKPATTKSSENSSSKPAAKKTTQGNPTKTATAKPAGTNTSKPAAAKLTGTSSSKTGDKSLTQMKKPEGSSPGTKTASAKPAPASAKSEKVEVKNTTQSPVVQDEKVSQTSEEPITIEQMLDVKANTMEQGLWRFSLRLAPLELGDLAKQEVRSILNTAQDFVVFFKNQGQNKKKRGESHMYFNRLLTTKCTMQKLFVLSLTSKKLELEIHRKIMDSKDKDIVILELDLTRPGTLATVAATNMLMTKSAAEDKNVHITNVPKNTTQELLFVVFPTAYSIQMPKDGKDKGNVIAQFRNAQCADDIMRCYTNITVNKMKLKLTRKTSSSRKSSELRSHMVTKPLEPQVLNWDSGPQKVPAVEPSLNQGPKVFQIQVLNKRPGPNPPSTPLQTGQPEAKRPRLDAPLLNTPLLAQPPPMLGPRFAPFPVPTSIPPPMPVPGFVCAMPGDYTVPPPVLPSVPPPMWPVTSTLPMNAPNPVTAPQTTHSWQTPGTQKQGFAMNRDLQDTEAISPEWNEERPRFPDHDDGPAKQDRFSTSFKRSLSPRPYHGSRSPGRSVRRNSRSPVRSRPRSVSPRRGYSQSKSSARHGVRRYSRSPPRHSRHYSPLSPERKDQSPRRSGPWTRKRQGDYSPISQGRLSRSPGRHATSPKRKNQPSRRRSQSPIRSRNRSYSPISQGRLSRSPGKQRNYGPRKRSHSPQRKTTSRNAHSSEKLTSGSAQQSHSVAKDARKSGPGQARQSYSGRRSPTGQPSGNSRGGGSGSDRFDHGSGRSSREQSSSRKSPSLDQQAMLLHKHITKALAVQQNDMNTGKSQKYEVTARMREDRGGWIGFSDAPTSSNPTTSISRPPTSTSRPTPSVSRPSPSTSRPSPSTSKPTTSTSKSITSASRSAVFPAAFSNVSKTPSSFPSASTMSIPGLDLLLAATAGNDNGSQRKSDDTKPRKTQEEEDVLRRDALKSFGKQDVYRDQERRASSGDRHRVQERDVAGTKDGSMEWRRDTPLFNPPRTRDSGAYSTAWEEEGRDLMNLRKEAAKHLVSRDVPRSQGMEPPRRPDLGRGLDSQSLSRERADSFGKADYRQPPMSGEGLRDHDIGMGRNLVSETQTKVDNAPPLKSALRKPTPSAAWPAPTPASHLDPLDRSRMDLPGRNRPGLDQPVMDRPRSDFIDNPRMDYLDRGMDHPSLGYSDKNRTGLDRLGIDYADDRSRMDNLGMAPPRMDRPELELPGMDRRRMNLPGMDPPGSFERPGFERWGTDRVMDRGGKDLGGMDRGLDRGIMDRGKDLGGTDRGGMDRGMDRGGMDRGAIDRHLWPDQPAGPRSEPWGDRRVQDWNHRRPELDTFADKDQSMPQGPPSRFAGPDYMGRSDLDPDRAHGLSQDWKPGPEMGRGGEGMGWQGGPGVGGDVGPGPYRGGDVWLPPPHQVPPPMPVTAPMPVPPPRPVPPPGPHSYMPRPSY